MGRHGPIAAARMITNSFTEGTEEVLQGMVDEFGGSISWSDDPYDFGWEEAGESFIGGVAGAGFTGFNSFGSLSLGITQRVANLKARNMAPTEDGWQFFVKKNEIPRYYGGAGAAVLSEDAGAAGDALDVCGKCRRSRARPEPGGLGYVWLGTGTMTKSGRR